MIFRSFVRQAEIKEHPGISSEFRDERESDRKKQKEGESGRTNIGRPCVRIDNSDSASLPILEIHATCVMLFFVFVSDMMDFYR